MSASRPGPTGHQLTGVKYPEVHVCLHSRHPLALVSAVRYALRRAGVDSGQISAFSGQALSSHSERKARSVCDQWVTVDSPAA